MELSLIKSSFVPLKREDRYVYTFLDLKTGGEGQREVIDCL